MKRKKASIIFLFVSLFVLSCFALSYNAKATSDINYTFIDNILYESDDIELSDSFNLQNESIATELYNATYSFTDDEIGSNPDGWGVNESGGTINVIDSLDGHSKLVEIYDNNDNVYNLMNDTSMYQSFGTIELWIRSSDSQKSNNIWLSDGGGQENAVYLYIDGGYFGYFDTVTHEIKTCSSNLWYHVRIDFKFSGTAYLGLNNDTFKVHINGKTFGPYGVKGTPTTLNYVQFTSGTVDSEYYLYLDAIGYTWEAIYDFTDEIDGTSGVDIDFIDLEIGTDSTYSSTVIASEDGHKKVVRVLASGDIGAYAQWFQTGLSETDDGTTIEGWMKYIDKGQGTFSLRIFGMGAQILTSIYFNSNDNKLYYIHGDGMGGNNDDTVNAIADTWYYIKIILDFTNDMWDLYFNGTLTLNDGNFYEDNTDTQIIQYGFILLAGGGVNSLEGYFDAIGESWNPVYIINDNIFPIFNITSNLVVAKDEFAYNANGEFYEASVKDACGWEGNDIDYVHLIQDNEPIYDKKYKINNTGTTANKFIRKYYEVNDGVYNFTLNINYLKMLNLDSSYWWTIASTLLNTIAVIELIYMNPATIGLRYLDDIDAETYTLIGTITYGYDIERELTLFIGDLCYLTYKDTTTSYEVIFPKLEAEEEGLYEIAFAGGLDDTDDIQIIHIDSIGVFVNGTSINNDFGSGSLDLDSATWYSKRNNIINVNALGIFGLGAFSETDSTSLKGFYNYTNIKTWNVYNYFPYITDPSLIFITNTTISILNLKITGVKMTDETFTFIPDFYYGSVNIDESYFYVDSSNRLQFNLICNDNYTEWIELRFFLVFIPTENTSIQFKSNIDGVSQGYVHLAHWGFATTDIYFPTFLKTTTVYLPQGHYIRDLSIIISDKDITYYDVCSGYITDLKFLYSPGGIIPGIFEFDITILISVLIPLIIILAPTLAMSIKFGKKGILPMFILMCLICTITNLIPIWVFFIIALSSGALLFMSHNRGGE